MQTQTDPVASIGHNQPPINERLAGDYVSLIKRRDELTAAHGRMPSEINDNETAGRVVDFIKQLSGARKQADKCRVDEKHPFLEGGRIVDGFFKGISDPLATLEAKAKRVLTAYQVKIAEAERKARAEAERKAQEESEKLQREAAERERAIEDERGLDAAIEAEEAAAKAEAEARTAERTASASVTAMTHTHSESGVSSSLSTFWNFRDIDPATIDLEALRPYLSMDALEKAVRGLVKSGTHECRGVHIFEDHKSNVR